MATLALTAVGTALGGPVGGMIGSLVGQSIDARLFAPKMRTGPRLTELAVQTSTYGTVLPKLFGTMRVAGTVIWSTNLTETRAQSGGGKGRPGTVTYSYSASFAVALSARAIRGVRRIWADGKLLRGAAGDFKSPVAGFRLHMGSESQAPDPLIAGAEGAGRTPAYRGLAYAVFENLALEEYGNRIPSLSFEVEADAAPVPVAAIADMLSEGRLRQGEDAGPLLAGCAVGEESLLSAVESMLALAPLGVADRDGAMVIGARSAAERVEGEQRIGSSTKQRRAASLMPGEVSLTYHDPARDYQAGLQRARREGGGRSLALSAAVVLDAGAAKALAEQRLERLWVERTQLKLSLPWTCAHLRPGDTLAVAGETGLWKISSWKLGPLQVALELDRLASGSEAAMGADAGRPRREADSTHGSTRLMLIELPFEESGGEQPMAFIAAAGALPGWRRAPLSVSFDDGGSWRAIGQTAAPAVMGRATTVLPPGTSALMDEASSISVDLNHPEMWLEGRTPAALASGANLALLGEELIQFGHVEPLGGGAFRLSRLLRGRRGTEQAAERHQVGEPFVLLQEEALLPLPLPAGSRGGRVRVMAHGIGDGDAGVEAVLVPRHPALVPPAPVHLKATPEPGALHISWTRRSRRGWAWSDGSDVPLGEERELYRLRIASAHGERVLETTETALVVARTDLPLHGFAGLQIDVSQIGTHAASPPARFVLQTEEFEP